MGKLLSGLGQLIIGFNYLITSILVALKYGLVWGVLSFAAVPIGALAAPFFVGTGFWVIIGAIIFLIGYALSGAKERQLARAQVLIDNYMDSKLRDRFESSQVVGNAKAISMFQGEDISGPGKLIGSEDGNLTWFGDNGVRYDIGNSIRSWGKPQWGFETKDFYFVTSTSNEFVIDASDYSKWENWFSAHHPK